MEGCRGILHTPDIGKRIIERMQYAPTADLNFHVF